MERWIQGGPVTQMEWERPLDQDEVGLVLTWSQGAQGVGVRIQQDTYRTRSKRSRSRVKGIRHLLGAARAVLQATLC